MKKYYFYDTNTRTVVTNATTHSVTDKFDNNEMRQTITYVPAGSWLVTQYVKNDTDKFIYFLIGSNEYVRFDQSDMYVIKNISKQGKVTVQRLKRYGVLDYAHKDGTSYSYESSNNIDGTFTNGSEWLTNTSMLASNYFGYYGLATDIYFGVARALFENGSVKDSGIGIQKHYAYVPANTKYFSSSNIANSIGSTESAQYIYNPAITSLDRISCVCLSNGYYVHKDDVYEVMPYKSIITTCTPFPKIINFDDNAVNKEFDMGQQIVSYGYVENGKINGFLIDNNTVLDTTDTYGTTLMYGDYFEGVDYDI